MIIHITKLSPLVPFMYPPDFHDFVYYPAPDLDFFKIWITPLFQVRGVHAMDALLQTIQIKR